MQKKRNGEIDLLRFLLAAMIMLFHAGSFYGDELFPGGNLCVEFFFIISGYLMMVSIDRKNKDGRSETIGVETTKFLQRKISALMPEYLLAWVVSFCVIYIAKDLSRSGAMDLLVRSIWEMLFLKMTGLNGPNVNGVVWYICYA